MFSSLCISGLGLSEIDLYSLLTAGLTIMLTVDTTLSSGGGVSKASAGSVPDPRPGVELPAESGELRVRGGGRDCADGGAGGPGHLPRGDALSRHTQGERFLRLLPVPTRVTAKVCRPPIEESHSSRKFTLSNWCITSPRAQAAAGRSAWLATALCCAMKHIY